MKYLCLVHCDEQVLARLSAADGAALTDESLDYDEGLRRSGHFLEAHALQPSGTAGIVRVRHRKPSVTDGPFAETKEQVCGFILIDAASRDEALQLAAGIPMARLGSIEVRAVQEMRHS
jgi:hypothetical protein